MKNKWSTLFLMMSLWTVGMAQCPPQLVVCPDVTIQEGDEAHLWATGCQTYEWTPAFSLSDNTIANPVATPTQTTTYYVTGYNVGGTNIVVNGDFESGNTGFQTDYIYVMGHNMSYGRYAINTDGLNVWNAGGHVYGYGGTGSFMIVDGADHPNATVWSQTVNVQPNTTYAFSAQVVSMLNSYQSGCQALLQFCINGVQVGPVFQAPSTLNTWVQYYEIWNSGNATTATLSILNQNQNGTGNDFGLDDISLFDMSTCSATDSVVVYVEQEEPMQSDTVVREICVGEMFEDEVFFITPEQTNQAGTFYFSKIIEGDSVNRLLVLCLIVHDRSYVEHREVVEGGEPYDGYGIYLSEEQMTNVHTIDTTIVLTNRFGCDSVVHIVLLMSTLFDDFSLYLPNAITPNDDGLNDYFCIPQSIQPKIAGFQIVIYNRFGGVVFLSKDKNFKWYGGDRAGTKKNVVYNYIITYSNLLGKPTTLKGCIVVL
ncbi:MAG: gliding motility-associated C-terminal domain-containing protein [Bacteroidales bacterium]|nr:gliding motility-associated C-terminal domain-containing protein [Bacteroidales bacterium]